MIRILIVDDHPLFRAGLTSLFETVPDVEVVGEAADGGAAVAMVAESSPDVVLTTFDEDEYVEAALRAGVSGFLLKVAPPERLVEGVRTVASGGGLLAPALPDRVVPADQVYDEAVAWARQFVGGATLAMRAAKESIDKGLEVDLATGLEIERAQFASLFATEDRTRGMESFLESGPGKAEFVGR